MKTGDSVRMGKATCLNCAAELDGATGLDVKGAVRPAPGDFTVCLYCGHLMVFDEALQFRELTAKELFEMAADRRLVEVSRARHQMGPIAPPKRRR